MPAMSSSRLRVFPDERAVGDALGTAIAADIAAAARESRRYVLGCPGGRSPMSTYQAMATYFARHQVDLSMLVIAMMDDYLDDDLTPVDADAHYSCRRFARVDIQGLFNAHAPRPIPDTHVWFPDPADPAAYDERLRAAGGVDFFILASGAGDGHVAFNPPGTPRDARSRIVPLAEQTRRDNLATFPDFRGLDDVPRYGVTVGVGTIRELSRQAALVAVGADKVHAVERLLAGDTYDPAWPATVFREIPGALLYADAAAAGGLASGGEDQAGEGAAAEASGPNRADQSRTAASGAEED